MIMIILSKWSKYTRRKNSVHYIRSNIIWFWCKQPELLHHKTTRNNTPYLFQLKMYSVLEGKANDAYDVKPLPPWVRANHKNLTAFFIKYFSYLFQQ